jgi:hypothetical protein
VMWLSPGAHPASATRARAPAVRERASRWESLKVNGMVLRSFYNGFIGQKMTASTLG